MTPPLTPIECLYGEVAALRVVVERLLAHMAFKAGDVVGVTRREHEQALEQLSRIEFFGGAPSDRMEAVRAHAEAVLDQIHTIAGSARKRGNPR